MPLRQPASCMSALRGPPSTPTFFARNGGQFVLRIEDTDTERNVADSAAGIVDGLRWLGLDWDEGYLKGGPTARTSRPSAWTATTPPSTPWSPTATPTCYCTNEELEQRRQAAERPACRPATTATAATSAPTRSGTRPKDAGRRSGSGSPTRARRWSRTSSGQGRLRQRHPARLRHPAGQRHPDLPLLGHLRRRRHEHQPRDPGRGPVPVHAAARACSGPSAGRRPPSPTCP